MKEIDITDFIKGFKDIPTNKDLAGRVKEIRDILTVTPEFQQEKVSDAYIQAVIEGTADSMDKMGEQISETIEKTNKKVGLDVKKGLTQGTQGLIGHSKQYIDVILGDVKSLLLPIGGMLKSGFSELGDVASFGQGKIDEVLGEQKDILVPFLISTKALWSMINSEQVGVMDGIKDTLDETFELQKDESLKNERRNADDGKKTGGWVKTLAIVAGIGMVLGGLLRSILIPFQLAFKSMDYLFGGGLSNIAKSVATTFGVIKDILKDPIEFALDKIKAVNTAILDKLKGWLGKLNIIGPYFDKISDTADVVGKTTGKIKKGFDIVKTVVDALGLKMKIFKKALIVGFKFLGWPLTIFIGVIDFIRGFISSTETTFMGKVADGLSKAVIEFFELFVRLGAWIVEKLSFGLFTDLGDKWVKKFGDIVRFTFSNLLVPFKGIMTISNMVKDMLSPIITPIKENITHMIDKIKEPFLYLSDLISYYSGDVMAYVTDMYKNIIDTIKMPFTFISEMVSYYTGMVIGYLEDKFGVIVDPIINLFDTIGDFMGKLVNYVKDKMKSIPIIGNLFTSDEDVSAELDTNKRKLSALKKGGDTPEEKSAIRKLQSTVNKQTAVVGRNEAKDAITQIFASGTGVDDLGRNKILKPSDLSEYTLSQLQNILKYGSWEKESQQSIQDAIKSKVAESQKAVSYATKTFIFNGMIVDEDTFDALSKKSDQEHAQWKQDAGFDLTDDDKSALSSISPIPAQSSNVFNDVTSSKINAKKRAISTQKDVADMINTAMKDMRKQAQMTNERPIVVNIASAKTANVEPPEDIESMSVLWLNKSFGLG